MQSPVIDPARIDLHIVGFEGLLWSEGDQGDGVGLVSVDKMTMHWSQPAAFLCSKGVASRLVLTYFLL
jgi:hypothetical protein